MGLSSVSDNISNSIQKMAKSIMTSMIEAIFPTKCLACRCFFNPYQDVNHQQASASSFLRITAQHFCPKCGNKIHAIQSPMCVICGKRFQTREGDDHICQDCAMNPPAIAKARSAFIYDTSLKNGIHQYKYNGKIQLARPFGRLLWDCYQTHFAKDPIDVILPVPLHPKRFRKRGFNQAFVLIRHWHKLSRDFTLKADSNLKLPDISKYALIRNKHTVPQTGLGKNQRLTNIKGAFKVEKKSEITGKHILLVDDVFTTGATANECARTLIRAGAKSVFLLTLARAV